MTLGIGMVPTREPGVVLITDSLVMTDAGNHVIRHRLDDAKLLWLTSPPAVCVISGYTTLGYLAQLGFLSGCDAVQRGLRGYIPSESDEAIKQCLRRLYGRLQAMHAETEIGASDEDLPSPEGPGPHVLFAVPRRERPPLLARFSGSGERWATSGDAFLIGAVVLGDADLLDELRQPMPGTLDECKRFAADWVGRFMDRHYGTRDALEHNRRTGMLPCLAFPLRAVTLTQPLEDS